MMNRNIDAVMLHIHLTAAVSVFKVLTSAFRAVRTFLLESRRV